MKKGFELRLYDKNDQVVFRELFSMHNRTRKDIVNRAKYLMDDPRSISQQRRCIPARYSVTQL
jgi:hypothetical protein